MGTCCDDHDGGLGCGWRAADGAFWPSRGEAGVEVSIDERYGDLSENVARQG